MARTPKPLPAIEKMSRRDLDRAIGERKRAVEETTAAAKAKSGSLTPAEKQAVLAQTRAHVEEIETLSAERDARPTPVDHRRGFFGLSRFTHEGRAALDATERSRDEKKAARDAELAAARAENAAKHSATLRAAKRVFVPPKDWDADHWRGLALVMGSPFLWKLLRDRGESGRLGPVLDADDLTTLYWALAQIVEGEGEARLDRRHPFPLRGATGWRPSLDRLASLDLLALSTEDGFLVIRTGSLVARILRAYETGEEIPLVREEENLWRAEQAATA